MVEVEAHLAPQTPLSRGGETSISQLEGEQMQMVPSSLQRPNMVFKKKLTFYPFSGNYTNRSGKTNFPLGPTLTKKN